MVCKVVKKNVNCQIILGDLDFVCLVLSAQLVLFSKSPFLEWDIMYL